MLDDALDLLRCPHCGARLARDGTAARCAAGHSFDVARQGYLNLLPGDAHMGSADSAAMVAARERFLGAGHYAPLVDAVGDAVAGTSAAGGCLVDVGAGTGAYLAAALDRLPGRTGVALDISRYALRRAARAHPRIAAVGCDAWRPLPLGDGVAAAALSVFAPRDVAELTRVLAPGGTLVVATPTPEHLAEAVEALGMLAVAPGKRERLAAELAEGFEPDTERLVRRALELPRADLVALAAMGPSGHHVAEAELERRAAGLPDPFPATLAAIVSTHRRRP